MATKKIPKKVESLAMMVRVALYEAKFRMVLSQKVSFQTEPTDALYEVSIMNLDGQEILSYLSSVRYSEIPPWVEVLCDLGDSESTMSNYVDFFVWALNEGYLDSEMSYKILRSQWDTLESIRYTSEMFDRVRPFLQSVCDAMEIYRKSVREGKYRKAGENAVV